MTLYMFKHYKITKHQLDNRVNLIHDNKGKVILELAPRKSPLDKPPSPRATHFYGAPTAKILIFAF